MLPFVPFVWFQIMRRVAMAACDPTAWIPTINPPPPVREKPEGEA
jgi:hypothetical protein